MSSKIERDLRELVAAEVISLDTSNNISNYYDSKKVNGTNRLFAIFGVLGSLLVGLGVILILAHNWDEFSRATKTIWAFVPLVVGQLFTGFTLWKKKSVAWKETAGTFLFFGIGASISLVSQIYNISGSMSSFLLTWILLAAPLIYLLRSHAVTLLFLIFATSYACNLGYFNDEMPWLYVLMLIWAGVFYFRQLKWYSGTNLTGIYNWVFPLSIIISLGAFTSGSKSTIVLGYLALFCLFYNLGKLKIFSREKMRANGYLLLGSMGTVYVLMMSTFRWIWKNNTSLSYNGVDMILPFALALMAIVVMVYLFKKKEIRELNLFQFAFFFFAFIYITQIENTDIPLLLTNLLVLGLGIFAVRIGSKQNRFSVLNYGLLIITILIACRFFDTDISFVIKGFLFVLIGAGFFGANYLMYRKQQKLETHE